MNKHFTSSVILFFSAFLSLTAQTDTIKSIYKKLDTLVFYDVSLSSGPAIDCNHFDFHAKMKYFVNCKEVSKEVYMKYENIFQNLGKCKPCYMKIYNEGDTLVSEGPHYTDCQVGTSIEYYPDGKVKCIKSYRENPGKWKGNWTDQYCSIAEGEWVYFDENGTVTKRETYKDGKLVQ